MHRVVQEISEANSWRDGEFAKFKVNSTGVEESLWFRMCIPMIYAHWEGYVVDSLKTLISHLNSLNLDPTSVQTNLVVVGMGDSYKRLSGKQSFEQRVEFTDKFSQLFKGSLEFSRKVNTRSNLKSSVLKELCVMFGLRFEEFGVFASDIDTLVHIRNSIAHGENSVLPDQNNILKYINSVSSATDVLLIEIERFLDSETYLELRNQTS